MVDGATDEFDLAVLIVGSESLHDMVDLVLEFQRTSTGHLRSSKGTLRFAR